MTPRNRCDSVVAIFSATVEPSRSFALTTRTESIAERPFGIDEHPMHGDKSEAVRQARSSRAPMRPMRFGVALPALLLLGACAGPLPHPVFAPQPTDALIEVARPPPPARVEAIPARPRATAVWLDGEWAWRRGRWAWLIGRWAVPPQGAVFSPWYFVRGLDGSLYYAPGVWRDAKGDPIDPPPALARAQVESNIIVDADGTVEATGPTILERTRPSEASGTTGNAP
jgi:hypothetical protein